MSSENCPNPNGCEYCAEFGCPRAEVVAAWRITNKVTGTVQYREQPLADLPFNRKHWVQEALYLRPANVEAGGQT